MKEQKTNFFFSCIFLVLFGCKLPKLGHMMIDSIVQLIIHVIIKTASLSLLSDDPFVCLSSVINAKFWNSENWLCSNHFARRTSIDFYFAENVEVH
uniref:Secreted protein n=1 Tax=Rhizophora mucronata TaxID=61149 RepID=A0A2P2MUG0_RHIMU